MLRLVYSDEVAHLFRSICYTTAHGTGTGMMDLIGNDMVTVIPQILHLVALRLQLLDKVQLIFWIFSFSKGG